MRFLVLVLFSLCLILPCCPAQAARRQDAGEPAGQAGVHNPPGRMQEGEHQRAATGSVAGERDPHDSQEAQKKAEAALRRTGPTGPHLVGIVASSSDLVVLSDDLVIQENPARGGQHPARRQRQSRRQGQKQTGGDHHINQAGG